jgi:uncharacterized LabA/DUF88 family protein
MIQRSNTAQIGLGAIAVAGCAIGIGFKQPTLTSLALATTTPVIISSQIAQKDRKKFDRKVAEIINNNLTLQARCTEQQKQIISLSSDLSKVQQKTAKQETRQRLVQSKIDKVQHSVKVALRASKVTEIQPKKLSIQNPPQPLKTIPIAAENSDRQPVTHVYIDGNNLHYACELLDIELDCNALRIELTQDAAKTQFNYYVGVHPQLTWQQKKQLSTLKKGGYEVLTFPLVKREDNKWKTVGDDVKLSIDMVQAVKSGDRVILVSGDGDFLYAIEQVKNRGANVTVVAHPQMLNKQLSHLADDFISLEDIKYKIAKHRKLVIA